MQVIPAMFGSLFGTGAAGGVAAGAGLAAGKVAAGGLFSGSTLFSILQGGATVLSAMSAVQQGQEQAVAYEAQSAEARDDAAQEAIDGRQRRTGLRKELADALAEADVAYAASGLDLSFGTPATARDASVRSAANALSADLGNEDARKARLMERSRSLTRMAADARRAGRIKAGGLMLSGFASMLSRG